jgi:hypothetical protein
VVETVQQAQRCEEGRGKRYTFFYSQVSDYFMLVALFQGPNGVSDKVHLSLTRMFLCLQHPHFQSLHSVADTLWLHTEPEARGIFGVPLITSIPYANVAISLFNETGESYIYGYVPIVVAKCGVFLKEKGKSPVTTSITKV